MQPNCNLNLLDINWTQCNPTILHKPALTRGTGYPLVFGVQPALVNTVAFGLGTPGAPLAVSYKLGRITRALPGTDILVSWEESPGVILFKRFTRVAFYKAVREELKDDHGATIGLLGMAATGGQLVLEGQGAGPDEPLGEAPSAMADSRASTGTPEYIVFAHGTSREFAESIIKGGLSKQVAAELSLGGRYSQTGSFFTFNVTESGQEAVQLAYEMGFRQAVRPVVLIARIPREVYSTLVQQRLVSNGPIPGTSVPETVFTPESYNLLNEGLAAWSMLDPSEGR